MEIGELTWVEKQLVLDDRIRRARRVPELLRGLVKEVSGEDADVLFDMIVEAKRNLERLESMKRGREAAGHKEA